MSIEPYVFSETFTGNFDVLNITSASGTQNLGTSTLTVGTLNTTTENVTNLNIAKAGEITFPGESNNPSLNPVTINGSVATQGSLVTVLINNLTAAGARTDAAAANIRVRKFGEFVYMYFLPEAINTPANAVAAAAISFPASIPAGYRPSQAVAFSCQVENNGATAAGTLQIDASGNILIQPGGPGGTFTNAAMCAMQSGVGVVYTTA